MIKIDTSDFSQCLREVAKATKKDGADVLNRAGRNTTIQTKKLTKKTSAAQISAELIAVVGRSGRTAELKYLLAAKSLGAKAGRTNKRGVSSLTNKAGKLQWRDDVRKKAARIVAARRSASGYLQLSIMMAGKAFGWFTAIATPKGWARESKGEKATERRLTANIQITVPDGAEGHIPLEDGVKAAAIDMVTYANKRLDDMARKFSARKTR